MGYDSFKTNKRRLLKSWKKSQKNYNEIEEQKFINIRVDSRLESVIPNQEDIDKIYRFNTDWQPMVASGTGEVRLTLKQGWEVELNPFQEIWVPFLKIEPIVRVGGEGLSGSDNGHNVLTESFFKKQVVFNLQDITTDGVVDEKNKILLVSVSLWFAKSNDISSLPQYESKLLIEFHNPIEFV